MLGLKEIAENLPLKQLPCKSTGNVLISISLEPPVDVHGFVREIAASQRKSGTGNALISVSLDIKTSVRDYNINLRKSDIFCLGCHIQRDFVNLAKKQQGETAAHKADGSGVLSREIIRISWRIAPVPGSGGRLHPSVSCIRSSFPEASARPAPSFPAS